MRLWNKTPLLSKQASLQFYVISLHSINFGFKHNHLLSLSGCLQFTYSCMRRNTITLIYYNNLTQNVALHEMNQNICNIQLISANLKLYICMYEARSQWHAYVSAHWFPTVRCLVKCQNRVFCSLLPSISNYCFHRILYISKVLLYYFWEPVWKSRYKSFTLN